MRGSLSFVRGVVSMAELPGSEAATELLVDTGSQMTILRRDVIERLGVDLDRDLSIVLATRHWA
jgi:hypothetical protein